MELNTIKNNGRWDGVAGDLNNNFSKIGTELEKQKHFSNRFKGLFPTADKLAVTVPHPQEGDWAVIGNTIPGPVWRYSGGSWSATGEIGGGPKITFPEISDQYGDSPDKGVSQRFFTQEVKPNRHTVLNVSEYEVLQASGAIDPDMLYMTYEEE